MIYLQDMVVHYFVAVGRDVTGVHRDGMSSLMCFI
jgi:hypothetical protein